MATKFQGPKIGQSAAQNLATKVLRFFRRNFPRADGWTRIGKKQTVKKSGARGTGSEFDRRTIEALNRDLSKF